MLQLLKGLTAGLQGVEACGQRQQEQNTHHDQDISFGSAIDGADGLSRLSLRLVVQDQEAEDDLRDHGTLVFDFVLKQRPGRRVLARAGERKNLVERVPEVTERQAEL